MKYEIPPKTYEDKLMRKTLHLVFQYASYLVKPDQITNKRILEVYNYELRGILEDCRRYNIPFHQLTCIKNISTKTCTITMTVSNVFLETTSITFGPNIFKCMESLLALTQGPFPIEKENIQKITQKTLNPLNMENKP